MTKWTMEKCKEEALQYNSRTDFHDGSPAAYGATCRRGWLDTVCDHMPRKVNPANYWSFARCESAAHTCSTRIEFQKEHPAAYFKARTLGWLDQICGNHKRPGNFAERFVYQIYNENTKELYIGISTNPKKRFTGHSVNGPCKNMIADGAKMTILTDLLPTENAVKIEISLIHYWRNVGEIKVLNIHRGGGVGFIKPIWTVEKLSRIASLYSNRSSFQKQEPKAYDAALRHGVMDQVCSHMERLCKPPNYWSKSRCSKVAKEYSTRTDFARGHSSAYGKSAKNGWLDEVCSHMRKADS